MEKFDLDQILPLRKPEEDLSPEEKIKAEGKIPAILAYVPFLCFYALILRRDNPYAYQHGKQGLILFLAELIAIALRWDLLWNLILILLGAVAVWGMVAALRGQPFRLPVVSDLLDHFQP
jgi:uncharacterized membrane protein